MPDHPQHPSTPAPTIVGDGIKRPLGSTRQKDLVRASLLLCPPTADEKQPRGER
jgi:hypothetical protein